MPRNASQLSSDSDRAQPTRAVWRGHGLPRWLCQCGSALVFASLSVLAHAAATEEHWLWVAPQPMPAGAESMSPPLVQGTPAAMPRTQPSAAMLQGQPVLPVSGDLAPDDVIRMAPRNIPMIGTRGKVQTQTRPSFAKPADPALQWRVGDYTAPDLTAPEQTQQQDPASQARGQGSLPPNQALGGTANKPLVLPPLLATPATTKTTTTPAAAAQPTAGATAASQTLRANQTPTATGGAAKGLVNSPTQLYIMPALPGGDDSSGDFDRASATRAESPTGLDNATRLYDRAAESTTPMTATGAVQQVAPQRLNTLPATNPNTAPWTTVKSTSVTPWRQTNVPLPSLPAPLPLPEPAASKPAELASPLTAAAGAASNATPPNAAMKNESGSNAAASVVTAPVQLAQPPKPSATLASGALPTTAASMPSTALPAPLKLPAAQSADKAAVSGEVKTPALNFTAPASVASPLPNQPQPEADAGNQTTAPPQALIKLPPAKVPMYPYGKSPQAAAASVPAFAASVAALPKLTPPASAPTASTASTATTAAPTMPATPAQPAMGSKTAPQATVPAQATSPAPLTLPAQTTDELPVRMVIAIPPPAAVPVVEASSDEASDEPAVDPRLQLAVQQVMQRVQNKAVKPAAPASPPATPRSAASAPVVAPTPQTAPPAAGSATRSEPPAAASQPPAALRFDRFP